uniref:Gustatory receptor n=1 Tax=Tetranychus urticae TaxID=32264 RepID=T1KAL4_TETUR
MFQITTLDGGSSYSKPIGLLASMLRFEGRKSKLTYLFIICIFIYVILREFITLSFLTNNKLEICHQCINLISLSTLLFWFLRLRSKRGQYIELIGIFENQTRYNLDNSQVYNHFTSLRKIFWFCFVSVVFFSEFANIYAAIMTIRKLSDYVQLGQKLLLCLIDVLGISCFQLKHQFLVESCLHIHACWLTVNEHVRSLNNIESRLLNIYKVREVRSMYSIAAVITEQMDSFIRIPLFNFFSYFIFSSFNIIAQVWSMPTLFGFIQISLRLMNLIFITYNTLYVHYLSNKCFDDVYSLSYKVRSIPLNNEVQIFLDRISQSDIGFSFLKIALITPTFVTSWTSTTLTFVLSLPSLL